MRAAFALLTVVPLPKAAEEWRGERVACYFPWVGLALGAGALGVLVVANAASVGLSDGGLLERGSWPIAAAIVAGWALLTRMLHWDGLADVADGFWGSESVDRRLEIMADTRTGAFGASAVAFVALLQVASVATLLAHGGFGVAVFAAPVFGRMAATFGSWLGRPARPGGLGAAVAGRPGLGAILVASLALGIAAASMYYEHGASGLAWSGLAFVASMTVPHLLSMRFGGITGDVLGASVLLTETFVLFAAALMAVW